MRQELARAFSVLLAALFFVAACGRSGYEVIDQFCTGPDDPLLGTACDGPDSDSCPDDTFVACVGGVLQCGAGDDDIEGPAGYPTCFDTIDNDCDGPSDAADSDCSGATEYPPVAAFVVSPTAGDVSTVFAFDASPTSDAIDSDDALVFSWDFDGDGIFDASGLTPTHSFPSIGLQLVTLKVRDTSGLVDYFVGTLFVYAPGTSTGVSTEAELVAAIDYANLNPGQTIQISAGTTITLTADLPAVTGADTTIVGEAGSGLQGTPTTQDGLLVTGDRCTLLWLEVRGCTDDGVSISSADSLVAHCSILENGDDGLDVGSGANGAVLRHNVIANNAGNGLDVTFASDVELADNEAHHNRTGIQLTTLDRPYIHGNTIWENGVYGIQDNAETNSARIWHNTIHGNSADGIGVIRSGVGPVGNDYDIRNNILTSNGGQGIQVDAGTFLFLDYNDYFINVGGSCGGTVCALELNRLQVNADYVAPATGDFRLKPTSQCIDQAFDLGVDRNEAGPGNFYDGAPDIGAWEAWQP
jgi:hypothetical protein